MATRTIVTSQPDVACDVCERRLLRGEQPDIFLAAGRRRTVCELCAPRAAHEGWMRERDSPTMALPPLRARRGRSFFERLPVPFRVRQVDRPPGESIDPLAPGSSEVQAPASYDFLDGYARPGAEAESVTPRAGTAPVAAFAAGDTPAAPDGLAPESPAPVDPGTSYLAGALEVFNASEFPRRVAGVARSLGAPEVNVRSAEHLESVVVIVVAWELSWYRYEVDLSEDLPAARATAQGTELSELEREERVGNAVAGDSGTLSLTRV
jgi:hypothetical protein